MARYFDVHPDNPQPRAIEQVVAMLRDDKLLAYPTDSGYALGIQLGNREGLERIRTLRKLDSKHHFTLVCKDFAQLGQLVHLDNAPFRSVRAAGRPPGRSWPGRCGSPMSIRSTTTCCSSAS